MPQLDTTWYASQIFWLCISFATMVLIMGKFFAPRIADILNQRQHKIDDSLAKAKQIQEQAEESLKKYHTALEQATQQANLAIEQAHKELDEYMNKAQEDLSKKLDKKIKTEEAAIQAEKDKVLQEVHQISEELALDIINKIGLTEIKAKDIKDAIKKVAND